MSNAVERPLVTVIAAFVGSLYCGVKCFAYAHIIIVVSVFSYLCCIGLAPMCIFYHSIAGYATFVKEYGIQC